MARQSRPGRCCRRVRRYVALSLFSAVGLAAACPVQAADGPSEPELALFIQAASSDEERARAAMEQLSASWRDGYAAMFIDMARLMRPDRRRSAGGSGFLESGSAGAGAPSSSDPGSPVRRRLIRFLERQTGKRFGDDLDRWRKWIWSLDYAPHAEYAQFKGGVYGNIDPRMREFFPSGARATIRLDQVDWGGVAVGGVPALDHPGSLPSRQAGYLEDKDIVFGVVADGQARAYPKRILGWHELVRDTLGGVPLALVYCTLCGSAIPYESRAGGRDFTFDTSGLLYRSNKLMFDDETRSLWSSLKGRPVIGALAGSDLELPRLPIVTTTWGEWRRMHPDTSVLSLDTGFDKDYSEGAAYREYFRTDRLMFEVPDTDRRLKNKAEVLVLGAGDDGAPPLAIAAGFLNKNLVYSVRHGRGNLVVLSTRRGANRVYDVGDVRIVSWIDAGTVADDAGGHWTVTAEALVATDGKRRLPRRAAHRVFWFGWYAQYPDTVLIR